MSLRNVFLLMKSISSIYVSMDTHRDAHRTLRLISTTQEDATLQSRFRDGNISIFLNLDI